MVGRSLMKDLKSKGFNNLLTLSSKKLDLRNRNATFKFFKKKRPEYVFHAASKVGGIKASMDDPVGFLRDNLLINVNVIDACYKFKVKKLVNLGSSCIYPKETAQPMKEKNLLSSKFEPTNEGYSLSKICSLKLCEYYNKKKGTNFISLMPPNLYGEYDKFDKERSHVIGALIMKIHAAKIEEKKEVEIWGTGNAKREFMYVGDISKAMIFAMENLNKEDLWEQGFLNTGTGNEVTIKKLANLIKKVVGFKGKLIFDKTKPEGVLKKLMDSSLFLKKGFKPEVKLEVGLKKAYKYYLFKINN